MEYVVQQGDTVSKIAARFGTTVQAIVQLNPSLRVNPNFIFPGQRIQIPVARLTPEDDFYNFFGTTPTPAAGDPSANPQSNDAAVRALLEAEKKKKAQEQQQLLVYGGVALVLVVVLMSGGR
jgi:LysM repeat protein